MGGQSLCLSPAPAQDLCTQQSCAPPRGCSSRCPHWSGHHPAQLRQGWGRREVGGWWARECRGYNSPRQPTGSCSQVVKHPKLRPDGWPGRGGWGLEAGSSRTPPSITVPRSLLLLLTSSLLSQVTRERLGWVSPVTGLRSHSLDLVQPTEALCGRKVLHGPHTHTRVRVHNTYTCLMQINVLA